MCGNETCANKLMNKHCNQCAVRMRFDYVSIDRRFYTGAFPCFQTRVIFNLFTIAFTIQTTFSLILEFSVVMCLH